MKILLIGASGNAGKRILEEALDKGHSVTAVLRDPSKLTLNHKNLTMVKGDLLNPDSILKYLDQQDAIISAYGPKHGEEENLVVAAKNLVDLIKSSKIKRLLVVGGAGSLEVAPGLALSDTPEFLDAWKPVAFAHRDALRVYEESDISWTFLSPSATFEPGERTGKYKLGNTTLLYDENGLSRISMEDYATAMIDELENKSYERKQFTVGSKTNKEVL
ncbi:NAD(P)-dependent oxidoreductase [Clostridium estertheticum]|uniref:NAD(P)-dependent oxidoreductase n=1 Tax=Clostridium estertheticum TaxID=238834 RepID=UPI001C0D6DDF|nr:NAD(P)-dependent oxidoreductase [Clostridium estertheticum]MBU3201350.1 NAD(P)-dependent oxidoreductase [Clostridium estertheticum]WAG66645.1 NAD(P)-dependent oxidoreductase [Clostridium estertheticum]